MQIIRCDSTHDPMWNEFVQSSPRASFYHRAEWRSINERCFGHQTAYLGAMDHGRIIGIFPIVRLKSLLFGNIACSMPFVNYGGPCSASDEIEARLMSAGAAVADEWGVDYLEVRSQRYLSDRYPSSDHKVSMTIALDPDPEAVMARFKRDQRAEIRRAAKNGFVTRFGPELVEDFYRVLSSSWRELGTPIFGIGYLKAILAAFPDSTRICVVYSEDGQPAAAAFDGIHNGTVEGMWLGMRSDYRRQLVGYVLYWELIKHACENGWRVFHLGRSSKDSGGEQFKKKWNAETLQLYWTYVLRTRKEMPALNPDNPRYRMAIKAWQKMPVAATQLIGPFIARSIP
ncbi:FemAB family XrtA/PEP-CTERM system-associated protein [Luteitalea sp.]|uniref:FemAB family XrtA/PEP-CTERM system-associated protein n=1 Tax=Luteitalea sp. TaxID=2004800 RepID=UPI0025B9FFB2|nr:FemAB family XrtA/PEP-CTERM system-associated protein [Luteitalea sp.]